MMSCSLVTGAFTVTQFPSGSSPSLPCHFLHDVVPFFKNIFKASFTFRQLVFELNCSNDAKRKRLQKHKVKL